MRPYTIIRDVREKLYSEYEMFSSANRTRLWTELTTNLSKAINIRMYAVISINHWNNDSVFVAVVTEEDVTKKILEYHDTTYGMTDSLLLDWFAHNWKENNLCNQYRTKDKTISVQYVN
jgi:hypothetical protein